MVALHTPADLCQASAHSGDHLPFAGLVWTWLSFNSGSPKSAISVENIKPDRPFLLHKGRCLSGANFYRPCPVGRLGRCDFDIQEFLNNLNVGCSMKREDIGPERSATGEGKRDE